MDYQTIEKILSSPITGYCLGGVGLLWGIFQGIKNQRRSKEFEIQFESAPTVISRNGTDYPWEEVGFQVLLEGSENQLQGISAILYPGAHKCKIPAIWKRGANHVLLIRSTDIPLIPDMKFTLEFGFRDLDNNFYTYTQPMILKKNGTLNLENGGVGKRKKPFLRNLFRI